MPLKPRLNVNPTTTPTTTQRTQKHTCTHRRSADGDVYRALLAAAQASPLNATEEGPAWEAVLKLAMRSAAAAAAGGGGGAAPRSRL